MTREYDAARRSGALGVIGLGIVAPLVRHYLKSIMMLTPTPRAEIAVLDLATVDLDVAALTKGYACPAHAEAPLHARVSRTARGARRLRRPSQEAQARHHAGCDRDGDQARTARGRGGR